jgi:hypothetical protein
MSTRSLIGIENEDGSVEYTYCHWAGAPEDNGRILADHYTSEAKIREMLALGTLSCLGPEIGEQALGLSMEEFWKAHPDWCCAHGRDRGDTDCEARTVSGREEYRAEDMGQEWMYLFARGRWLVLDMDDVSGGWRLLSDALWR